MNVGMYSSYGLQANFIIIFNTLNNYFFSADAILILEKIQKMFCGSETSQLYWLSISHIS